MEKMFWLAGIFYIVSIPLLVVVLYPLPQYNRRENIFISLLVMLMPIPGLPIFFMLHHRFKKLSDTRSRVGEVANNQRSGSTIVTARGPSDRSSEMTTGMTAAVTGGSDEPGESDELVVMASDSLMVTNQQLAKRADYLGRPGEDVYQDFLLSTQNMNDESAVDVLKQGMHSSTESTRLLSHAFYSKREDRHFKEVESLVSQLRNGQFHNPRLHIALAETYQHMINAGIFGQAVVQEVQQKIKLHACILLKYDEHRQLAQRLLSQANQLPMQQVKSARNRVPALIEHS